MIESEAEKSATDEDASVAKLKAVEVKGAARPKDEVESRQRKLILKLRKQIKEMKQSARIPASATLGATVEAAKQSTEQQASQTSSG